GTNRYVDRVLETRRGRLSAPGILCASGLNHSISPYQNAYLALCSGRFGVYQQETQSQVNTQVGGPNSLTTSPARLPSQNAKMLSLELHSNSIILSHGGSNISRCWTLGATWLYSFMPSPFRRTSLSDAFSTISDSNSDCSATEDNRKPGIKLAAHLVAVINEVLQRCAVSKHRVP